MVAYDRPPYSWKILENTECTRIHNYLSHVKTSFRTRTKEFHSLGSCFVHRIV